MVKTNTPNTNISTITGGRKFYKNQQKLTTDAISLPLIYGPHTPWAYSINKP